MLRPLEAGYDFVQFSVPLTPSEYQRLAAFLEDYPNVILRVFGDYAARFCDLSFLRFFPSLLGFEADEMWGLQSLAGIESVAPRLKRLKIGRTRRSIKDPQLLQLCERLESVIFVGFGSAVKYLPRNTVTRMALGYQRRDNLEVLSSFGQLRDLSLFHGSVKLLGGLRDLELDQLQLESMATLEDLSEVSELTSLRRLSLWRLPRVRQLPDLSRMERLTEIELVGMSRIDDLAELRNARRLEVLRVAEMNHLSAADFEALDPLRPLTQAIIGIGVAAVNDALEARLTTSMGH